MQNLMNSPVPVGRMGECCLPYLFQNALLFLFPLLLANALLPRIPQGPGGHIRFAREAGRTQV